MSLIETMRKGDHSLPLLKWRKILASVALIGLPLYSLGSFTNVNSIVGLDDIRANAAAVQATVISDEISDQARIFANQIASEPPFTSWNHADLSITALGPGTHSWLVLVKNNKQTIVGYMVLNAMEAGGYQLGEYGLSSEPLFGGQSFEHSMLQLGLSKSTGTDKIGAERIYIHPLLAAWKITSDSTSYYTDAATGEQLPVTAEGWETSAETEQAQAALFQAHTDHKLQKSHSIASFDPYAKLSWITNKPLNINSIKYSSLLVKINGQQQLRYIAERFDGQMLYAWSVVGYHSWTSGHAYIALEAGEDSGLRRYIPLQLLLGLGSFYS